MSKKPAPLRPTALHFVEEFVSNGGNATQAYLASHPNCTSFKAASVEGCRMKRLPHIARAIEQAMRGRIKRWQMDGDEAMGLIALAARADIAQAFDANGSLLPVHQWPDTLRLAVKTVKADGSISLVDPLRARELVATAEGRIKAKLDVNHSFDHAAFLEGLSGPPDTGGKP